MSDEDILAEIEAEEEPGKLKAVIVAHEYTVELNEEDFGDVMEAWEKIAGVLYRQGCRDVDIYDEDYGRKIMFILGSDKSIDEVLVALQDEVDEVTGRKAEKDAGDSWGMF